MDITETVWTAATVLLLVAGWMRVRKQRTPRAVTPPAAAAHAPTYPGIPPAITNAILGAQDAPVELQGPFSPTHIEQEELAQLVDLVLSRMRDAARTPILPVCTCIDGARAEASADGARHVDVTFMVYESHTNACVKLVARIAVTVTGDAFVTRLAPFSLPPGDAIPGAGRACAFGSYTPVVSPVI